MKCYVQNTNENKHNYNQKKFYRTQIKIIKHYTFLKYLYVWRDFFLFRSNMVVAMVTLDWWRTEITKDGKSLKNTAKNRVPKWWCHKNEICEIMGFVKLFWKNNVQDAYSPKISNLGQIVSEILAQLCSDDSIQIHLNLTWFLILWTKPNLEGFVWNRHSITGLISQRQFAPNC